MQSAAHFPLLGPEFQWWNTWSSISPGQNEYPAASVACLCADHQKSCYIFYLICGVTSGGLHTDTRLNSRHWMCQMSVSLTHVRVTTLKLSGLRSACVIPLDLSWQRPVVYPPWKHTGFDPAAQSKARWDPYQRKVHSTPWYCRYLSPEVAASSGWQFPLWAVEWFQHDSCWP